MGKFRTAALGLCVGAIGALAASSAGAVTYKVYDQFNIAAGAVTATDFAFGYLPAGGALADGLTAFARFDTQCAGNVNVQCAASYSGDQTPGVFKAAGTYQTGTSLFEPGELNLHPGAGGEATGVQFIAPTAGVYTFRGAFSLNDTQPSGVSLAAFVGDTSQFASILSGPRGASYAIDFTTTLAANERVTFLVGPNGAYSYDSTGFALAVSSGAPEPASWAMMIAGFGGAGAMLRRRRAVLA